MKLRFSTIFLIMAAICFLMPFVNVRCSSEATQTMSQMSPDSLSADNPDAKGEIFFYYTGLKLALGQEPTYPQPKTSPQTETIEPTEPVEQSEPMQDGEAPIVDEPVTGRATSRDPFVAVQAMEPEIQMEDSPLPMNPEAGSDTATAAAPGAPTSTAKPNIYALVALIFVLLGIFGSTYKGRNGLVITAVASVVAVAMLNLLKMNFGGYLQNYMQLEPDYMRYLEVEFTYWYWAAIALGVLAFIETAIRLLSNWGEEIPFQKQTVLYPTPEASLYQDSIEVESVSSEIIDEVEEELTEEDKEQS